MCCVANADHGFKLFKPCQCDLSIFKPYFKFVPSTVLAKNACFISHSAWPCSMADGLNMVETKKPVSLPRNARNTTITKSRSSEWLVSASFGISMAVRGGLSLISAQTQSWFFKRCIRRVMSLHMPRLTITDRPPKSIAVPPVIDEHVSALFVFRLKEITMYAPPKHSQFKLERVDINWPNIMRNRWRWSLWHVFKRFYYRDL